MLASAATVSVPFDLIALGTCAAIAELAAVDADDVPPELAADELLLLLLQSLLLLLPPDQPLLPPLPDATRSANTVIMATNSPTANAAPTMKATRAFTR